jgi:hypothetical protein
MIEKVRFLLNNFDDEEEMENEKIFNYSEKNKKSGYFLNMNNEKEKDILRIQKYLIEGKKKKI